MPPRHLDPEQSRRYAEYRYDFSRKAIAGRVVLVPGGAGGLGAGMKVVGVAHSYPAERLQAAHRVVDSLVGMDATSLRGLFESP